MEDEILTKLKEIIAPFVTETKNISINDKLREDVGIDSIDMVDIIIKVEDAFSVRFLDKEFNKLRTVRDIITNILLKIDAKDTGYFK